MSQTERACAATTILSGGGPDDVTAVRHLTASGSNREIGRAMAAAAESVHGHAARPQPADPVIEQVRRRWFAAHYPAHAERSAGIADHFGLARDDVRWSVDWLTTYDLPAGCSVAFYPGTGTDDGHGRLARNFDFPTATFSEIRGAVPQPEERPLAADVWVSELRPEDGYASVTIGIMDVMGAMDGINEAGLCVALLADNETPEPEPSGTPRVGLAEQQVVRYLLDTCATVAEARAALLMAKHYYFFTPCHYLVADRTGASFVWEHSPRRNLELTVEPRDPGTGRLACTNHLLHRWPDPGLLPSDDGPMGTAALTYHRWTVLDRALSVGGSVRRDEIDRHFRSVRFTAPVQGARTFWHGLYDLDDAAVDLSFYVGDVGDESHYSVARRFTACCPSYV
jgi:predicted choloylglycine hydrolase